MGSLSLVFQDMIKSVNHSHPLLYMRGVTSVQFTSTIQLIYTKVEEDDFENMLKLLKEFKLYGEGTATKKATHV